MPKYRAQDFLAEALQHRRSQLERMLVPPPHHMEFVEAYAHKGHVEDVLYAAPWLLAEFQHDTTGSARTLLSAPAWSGDGGHLRETLNDCGGLEGAVRTDLGWLAGGSSVSVDGVESFVCVQSSTINDDGGIDSDTDLLLSQEIDSAIDRFARDGSGGGERGRCAKEEFLGERMNSWDTGIKAGLLDLLVEEPESPCQREILISLVPRVDHLSRRLKAKLLQDPLVDDTGHCYTYAGVFRSDFQCGTDDQTEGDHLTNPTVAVPYEEFDRERIHLDEDEVDLMLELPLSISTSPGGSEAEATKPMLLPETPSPHRDLMEVDRLQGQSSDELRALVSEAKVAVSPTIEKFTFSPSEKLKLGAVDFSKLNDADVSHDSDDSGISVSRALLESPCLHFTSSPISTPLAKQLASLEPLPLSPDGRLLLMSPSSEGKLMKKIREKENMFDSILALTIPYPDIETLPGALTESCVPTEALFLLSLNPTKLDGDFELELPWDPLSDSYREMSLAQKDLVSSSYSVEKEDDASVNCTWKENFKLDSSVKSTEEEDVQIHLDPGRTCVPQAADIPNLRSANTLPGYPNAKPMEQLHRLKHSSPQPTTTKISHEPPTSQHETSSAFSPFTESTRQPSASPFPGPESHFSRLEAFILLRSGRDAFSGVKRKSVSSLDVNGEPEAKKAAKADLLNSKAEETPPRVTSPTFQDLCLTGEFQTALIAIGEHAAPFIHLLKPFGLQVHHGFQDLPVDRTKFFLKQQQKALDSCQEQERESLFESCQLAASLYVLVSFAETLMHCSLHAGLGRFSSLCQKYEEVIGARLDPVKQELLRLQLYVREHNIIHPKLHKLVNVVTQWMERTRRNTREKAVVLVEREFSILSGEMLDLLQTIQGLRCCVFSFTCDDTLDPLYLETLEERFYHYDCLVAPATSITSNFPWEKVSLLVEFEELKSSPAFPVGNPPENARLKEYVVLRTKRGISASALASSDKETCDLFSIRYVLIASENIVQNKQLLQLLEARFNIVLIARDYSEIKRNLKKSRSISYADLILDQSTGIVLRPLSLLSSDIGLKVLVSITNALSLQYERCWVILYAQAELSYPYGGSVPANLARLHASVSHYSSNQHHYEVKVLCASSPEEAIRFSRRVVEETHRASKIWSSRDWSEREWIAEDMTKQEMFLLSFPCLNSFSTQLLLRSCTVAQFLVLDEAQLRAAFPWLPEKVTKVFYKMCNFNCSKSHPKGPPPPLPPASVRQNLPSLSDLNAFAKRFAPESTEEDASALLGRVLGRRHIEDKFQRLPEHSFERSFDARNAQNHHSTCNEPIVLSSDDEANVCEYATAEFGEQQSEEVQDLTQLPYRGDTSEVYSGMEGFTSAFPHDPDPAPLYQRFHSESHTAQPTLAVFEDWEQQVNANRGGSKHLQAMSGSSFALDDLDNPTAATVPPTTQQSTHQSEPFHCNPAEVVEQPPYFRSSMESESSLRLHWPPPQKDIHQASYVPVSDSPFATTVDPSHMATEYYGRGAVSSRFVASSRVKRTPGPRVPIKSLDLGFDNPQEEGSHQAPQLLANDRAIATTLSTPGTKPCTSSALGLVSREATCTSRPSRISDLKSFHSKEQQQMSGQHLWEPISLGQFGVQPQPQFGGPFGVHGQKRPHGDYQVPSDMVSPPGREPSFYGSPSTSADSVRLSPARKKRLIYEKVPGNSGGQTRLAFR